MSEDEKLLAHTTTAHLNGKLIHIQAPNQSVVGVYVYFVGGIFKRAYQIRNLLCAKLASVEIAENRIRLMAEPWSESRIK